jgi:hypothetical protein
MSPAIFSTSHHPWVGGGCGGIIGGPTGRCSWLHSFVRTAGIFAPLSPSLRTTTAPSGLTAVLPTPAALALELPSDAAAATVAAVTAAAIGPANLLCRNSSFSLNRSAPSKLLVDAGCCCCWLRGGSRRGPSRSSHCHVLTTTTRYPRATNSRHFSRAGPRGL